MYFPFLYTLFTFLFRDRKDKEKDEISRMPKAKDEQAPVRENLIIYLKLY